MPVCEFDTNEKNGGSTGIQSVYCAFVLCIPRSPMNMTVVIAHGLWKYFFWPSDPVDCSS